MGATRTTAAVQRYLDELRADPQQTGALPIVRELLGKAAGRLHLLCSSMLWRSYRRLARPPLNLRGEELLSAVVERLIKALRESRPGNVREFFALANKHMRWELNDLARRLDERAPPVEFAEQVADRAPSEQAISAKARLIFGALDSLADDEREVFGLVAIQGLTHAEAAEVLEVSTKTVQRRLNSGRMQLAALLAELRPHGGGRGVGIADG
jgi:RNA polymerase sigma-70 factor (ECF subfamily)